MNRIDMVLEVAKVRGYEDKYTLKIGYFAEDLTNTDVQVRQMMWDILLGVN